jgi:branched-chain amino acid transport system permease protein
MGAEPERVTSPQPASSRVLVGLRRNGVVRLLAVLLLLVLLVVSRGDVLVELAGPGRQVLIQGVVTGILLGAVYGLVSLGLTVIFGVLDIVNFAHGALMTVAMYTAFVAVQNLGLGLYASIPLVVAVMLAVGALVQRVLVNRVMGQPLENQLLLTLGLSILIDNALLLGFSATPRSVRPPVGGAIDVFGAVATWPRIIAFAGAMAVAGLLFVLLQRTKLGTAIRAVAQNAQGAALVGIDVQRIYVTTFAIGTACAAVAAVLVLPFLQLEPTTGEQFNILAFVIVVLGGMGNVVGAVLGGFLVGLVQEVGGLVFPGQSKLLLVFVVFVLVLFLRPQGLLGKGESR